MSKTEIQVAIEKHYHCVKGIRHHFKLQWAALEPRWSPGSGRYLLAVEVLSDVRLGSSTIHIVTRARTTRADLLRLLDDALEEHLASGRCAIAAPYTPEMSEDAEGRLPVHSDAAAAPGDRATRPPRETPTPTHEQSSAVL